MSSALSRSEAIEDLTQVRHLWCFDHNDIEQAVLGIHTCQAHTRSSAYHRRIDHRYLRRQARDHLYFLTTRRSRRDTARKLQGNLHRAEVGERLNERGRVPESAPAPTMGGVRRQPREIDIETKGKGVEEIAAPQRRDALSGEDRGWEEAVQQVPDAGQPRRGAQYLRGHHLPQIDCGCDTPCYAFCDYCAGLGEVQGHTKRSRNVVGGAHWQDAKREAALCKLGGHCSNAAVASGDNRGGIALSLPAAPKWPRRRELLHQETRSHIDTCGLEHCGRGGSSACSASVGVLDKHHLPQ
jgi:hypothetical protein